MGHRILLKKRHLKNDAVPTIFDWTKTSQESTDDQKGGTSTIEKLSTSRMEVEEATDSASEGEGDAMMINLISRKTCDDYNDSLSFHTSKVTPCSIRECCQ